MAPAAAHEQHAVLVDVQCRIIDMRVVVLRSVEDDRAALERVGILRIGQVAVAEFLRDHAGLHDRGIEQVAAQHQEPGLLRQRALERANHRFIQDHRAAAQFSPSVRPLAVSALSNSSPCFISCATTAGTPPAR